MVDPNGCMHYANFLVVRTRRNRKDEDDRSPPPMVEVGCTACGGKWWYRREK